MPEAKNERYQGVRDDHNKISDLTEPGNCGLLLTLRALSGRSLSSTARLNDDRCHVGSAPTQHRPSLDGGQPGRTRSSGELALEGVATTRAGHLR